MDVLRFDSRLGAVALAGLLGLLLPACADESRPQKAKVSAPTSAKARAPANAAPPASAPATTSTATAAWSGAT